MRTLMTGGRTSWTARWVAVSVAAAILPVSQSLAGFAYSGDVSPANPATWTNSTTGYVGQTSSGTLLVNAGSDLRSLFGCLGDGSLSIGTLTVNGGGSTWTNGGTLCVGFSGAGNLSAINGGSISTLMGGYLGYGSFSSGSLTVSGPGSRWTSDTLAVGWRGAGSLRMVSGGTVSTTFESSIGAYPLSVGTVSVDGAGSTWNAGSPTFPAVAFMVGGNGSGILSITNGGSVANSLGFVGQYVGGTGVVTVDGAGSTWTNRAQLFIGLLGSGSLNITNSGSVVANGSSIGLGSFATGFVTVNGPGSKWNISGPFSIGGSPYAAGGAGTLSITTGGNVAVGDTTRLWNNGRVNYNGGSFSTATLTLSRGGDVILSAGADKTLKTTAISVDSANGSKIDLADNKAIVNYTGNSPIASIRSLLATGATNGWTGNGITSSSAAADASKALGYGEASLLAMTNFGGYDVDSTSLLIKYTWKGDTNLDGQVTISDLGDLASNWQSTSAVWTGGDFNYDGQVTISDLGDLAGNWQAGVGSPLGMSFSEALAAVRLGDMPVPEPAVGAAFAALALAGRLRRRK